MGILLTIIHVIVSLFLILVVLLQSGRGGGVGAALGGASAQVFGGRGAGNFLSRLTTGAAVVFFCTSLTLSMISSRHRSVMAGRTEAPAAEAKDGKPATDAAAPVAPAPKEGVEAAAPADEDAPAAQHPDAPAPTPPGVPSGDNAK